MHRNQNATARTLLSRVLEHRARDTNGVSYDRDTCGMYIRTIPVSGRDQEVYIRAYYFVCTYMLLQYSILLLSTILIYYYTAATTTTTVLLLVVLLLILLLLY